MPSWLPLLNYSTKYNISLSTLRRRIKARTIEFKLDQGKYLIQDEGPAETKAQEKLEVPQRREAPKVSNSIGTRETSELVPSNFVEASVLTSANRLVEEIKSAYAKILQEKEEQISLLKEEIGDLRMLVRILEESTKKPSPVPNQERQENLSTPSSSEDFLFSDFQNREI